MTQCWGPDLACKLDVEYPWIRVNPNVVMASSCHEGIRCWGPDPASSNAHEYLYSLLEFNTQLRCAKERTLKNLRPLLLIRKKMGFRHSARKFTCCLPGDRYRLVPS